MAGIIYVTFESVCLLLAIEWERIVHPDQCLVKITSYRKYVRTLHNCDILDGLMSAITFQWIKKKSNDYFMVTYNGWFLTLFYV